MKELRDVGHINPSSGDAREGLVGVEELNEGREVEEETWSTESFAPVEDAGATDDVASSSSLASEDEEDSARSSSGASSRSRSPQSQVASGHLPTKCAHRPVPQEPQSSTEVEQTLFSRIFSVSRWFS